jgi:hypothetical protein
MRIAKHGYFEIKPLIQRNEAASLTRYSLFDMFWKYENYHLIPECPKKYNLAYIMARHSVFLEKFNQQLLYMLNGGLIDQLVENAVYNSTVENLIAIRSVHFYPVFKVFTLIDLQLPFLILIGGCCFGLLVLLVEVLCKALKRKSVHCLINMRAGTIFSKNPKR